MSSVPIPTESHRLNVLLLDGGGVRGLSSLLILQTLMQLINGYITENAGQGETISSLKPNDVFDFVVGTSTGGLIALMLGKAGLTVEECIDQYHTLSTTIFKKKHYRGKITHGLAPTRYSGKCLRKSVRTLLKSKGLSEDLPMVSLEGHDKIAWSVLSLATPFIELTPSSAVVCREHEHASKYSPLKDEPVLMCSMSCDKSIGASVCDAARATSAAPTFFPVVDINGRYFVDGGMEHNNPSQAAYYHFNKEQRVQVAGNPGIPVSTTYHDNLDFSFVRYTNLGTGTKSQALPARKRDLLAEFVPGFIKMSIFLKRTLTEIAVSSESHAQFMRAMQHQSKGSIKYERFSAGNGVCWIKLDKYKELGNIRDKTKEYLKELETQKHLKRVADEISAEFLIRRKILLSKARETALAQQALSTNGSFTTRQEMGPSTSGSLSDPISV
ncbi:hypothetical protein MMC17_002290 [Xylographa soralifera]|nr:hypothetical protein [Xylographa soralifera]